MTVKRVQKSPVADKPRSQTVRLAAVQIVARPGERSAKLRAAIAAMEAAAHLDPSPDIFVLPAFVDMLGPIRLTESVPEPLAGPTTAALAASARELGVYIAYGMAEYDAGGPFATAVLLDPDGDVVLSQRQIVISRTQRKSFKPGGTVRGRQTLIGTVALAMRDDLLNDDVWAQIHAAGAQFVLGCAAWGALTPPPPSVAIAARAKLASACTLVADASITGDNDPPSGGDTCAISADGRVVQSAPPGATHVCIISAACAAKSPPDALRANG